MANPIALTPNQIADTRPGNFISGNTTTPTNPIQNPTNPAPAVVSAKDATTKALTMQNTMNAKTAGAQTQSIANNTPSVTTYDNQGNMIVTKGTLSNGTPSTQTIPKGAPGYIPNPADVQAKQQQQQQQQQQQNEATTTNNLTSAVTGSQPTQTTQPQQPNPPEAPPDADLKTSDGQIQFYNQNPQAFDTWAQNNGLNDEQVANIHYQASVQQFNNDATTAKSTLAQFAAGTYPLTSDQQAQLDTTKQQFDNLVKQQQTANSNYENGVRILGAVTGRAEYFPDMAMGEVQGAINSGLAKVATIQSQETQALSQMRTGFESNNFSMVTAAQKMLTDLDAQQMNNLKSVHDSIVSANQTAVTNAEKQQMDNWTMYVGKTNIDLQTKTQALDQMKFSEQQKMDASTILDNHIKNQIASADLALKQATYDATYGMFTGLPGSPSTGTLGDVAAGGTSSQTINNFKPTDIPGVKEAVSGVNYFDPTQFNDPAQAKAAEKIARSVGIAVVSAKDAPNVETATTVLEKLNQAQADFAKIATPNYPGSSIVGAGKTALNGVEANLGYSTQYQQDIQTYNNDRSTIISLAGQLTGGQSRALAFILNGLQNLLPKAPEPLGTGFLGTGIGAGGSFVPTNTADATAKFNSSRNIVYSGLKTVIPNANLPASGDQVFATTDDLLKAHPDRAAQAAKLANQGLSDADIKTILNY